MKEYRQMRQKFPLQLPAEVEQDRDTKAFTALASMCEEPETQRAKGKDWMGAATWKLIAKLASLLQSGRCNQAAARRMKREINGAIKVDKQRLTAEVGDQIVAELNEGRVHEAFRHLRGWYRAASETQSAPCPQTMARQTRERMELYAKRVSYGANFPNNGEPFDIGDGIPTEGELREAVTKMSHGRCGGASGIRAEHMQEWLRGAKREENPKTAGDNEGGGDTWREFTRLCTSVWSTGAIPQQLCWVVTVLLPKGGGDYRGIGLMEPIWKVLERVVDRRLEAIRLHDSLHGCLTGRGTGTGIIEAKLAQQLAHLEQVPFFGVFIDLKKAFDAMDRERCLQILEMHGVGPNILRLIRNFWDEAINVCRAKGNYGEPFKAGRGVTQGGPLSARLFNIIVDAVVREWMRLIRETQNIGITEEEREALTEALFAIFYVDDGYIASRDPEFLQLAINTLVETFKRVGLETNTKKTQAMVCTPGKIRTQLTEESYRRMRERKGGGQIGNDWEARMVECQKCNKAMQARNLRQHLADVHDIYQEEVVDEGLLDERAGVQYRAVRGEWKLGKEGRIQCPHPACPGVLSTPWMMRRHFRDVHPKDTVYLPWEGGPHPRCRKCNMQCNPSFPKHGTTETCKVGEERQKQRNSAIDAALAIRQLFHIEGEVLERVNTFRYLGRILSQDDDDIRAVRTQIKKARGIWARVSQVLRADNVPPKISAKFYMAVVQSVLLYGSESWNLSARAMARLEGFNIRAGYRMAVENKPRRGLHHVWVYPRSKDVLNECGMQSIAHYIGVRRDTILTYVVNRPIYQRCREGVRKRGSAPRQWWWEQPMNLDDIEAAEQ